MTPLSSEENVPVGSESLALRLERRFAHRRLKFTTPVTDTIPSGTMGEVDGMRFFFWFRVDAAAIDVGDFDQSRVDDNDTKRLKRWEDEKESLTVPEEIRAHEKLRPEPASFEPGRLPIINVRYRASLLEVTNVLWAENLPPEYAEPVFTYLLDNLAPCEIGYL